MVDEDVYGDQITIPEAQFGPDCALEDEDLSPGEHVCKYNADGMCEICGNVRYSSSLWDELSGV